MSAGDIEDSDRLARGTTAAECEVAAALWAVAVLAVVAQRTEYPHGAPAAIAFVVVAAGAYLAFGVGPVPGAMRALVPGGAARLLAGPLAVLALALAYAAAVGLPVLPRLAGYGAWLLAPALVLGGRDAGEAEDAWPGPAVARALGAALLLWLPYEFRLLPPMPVPSPGGRDLVKLLALLGALWLFLVARPLQGIGFRHVVSRRDLATALAAVALYAPLAIPAGLATGFLVWHPMREPARIALAPLVIYVLIAIPEELLFRGIIQNLLRRWLGPAGGLAAASVVFGLAHLPDWRYVALATVAGVAYGIVYERTGKITASAVTHALVDGVWVALLGG